MPGRDRTGPMCEGSMVGRGVRIGNRDHNDGSGKDHGCGYGRVNGFCRGSGSDFGPSEDE